MNRPFPVYVVDDDPNIRDLLCVLCEERCLRCDTFENGEDFLEALNSLDPGTVLLDMRLPGRDGLQIQAEMAERRAGFAVIAFTGHGYVEMAVESMKMGAIDFLEKPFETAILFEALDRAQDVLARTGSSSPGSN